MKLFRFFFIIIFIQNCSFDNKSGIWRNENKIVSQNNQLFKDFKDVNSSVNKFNIEIPIKNNFKFNLLSLNTNEEWSDEYFNEKNNYKNFSYGSVNKALLKSKKLTRYNINKLTLFKDNYFIFSNENGDIIFFSIEENQIKKKFNFYKKKFKKIKKKLNLAVDENKLYVSDNLGFLYSYDFKTHKVVWAKKIKIPFRSNLKLTKTQLIGSDQNNNLYIFDKRQGNTLKLIPTEDVTIKNNFKNNLLISNGTLFFLNTYGSLYSINLSNMQINWFVNLNRSLSINPSSLFNGNVIVAENGKIVVSANDLTYIINQSSGSILHKKNFSSKIKPIIHNQYLFIITKYNYLVSLNLETGKIIYSYNINSKVAEYLDTKRRNLNLKSLMLVNNQIYIFTDKPYIIKFNINGSINNITKLPFKTNSLPLIVSNSIMFLNKKNRLVLLN